MKTEGIYETREQAIEDPKSARQYWLDALDAAGTEEKDWREVADRTWKIYTGETRAAFNILHANTETIVPAVYNSTPIPDCRPRYNDRNEIARKAAQTLERALSYQVDEYDFDEKIEKVVRDMAVPGRGIAWVNFVPMVQPSIERLIWASVTCEHVPWERFRHGPGNTWDEVPWVARQKFMTRDELIELAGEEIGQEVELNATQNDLTDKENKAKREKTVWLCAEVWEIWDRDTRKVWYVATGFDRSPIAVLDDPLGLAGFFPCPRPMQALSKPGSMTPIVPYTMYSAQAEEMNTISQRILKLVSIAKYRGIRASEVAEFDQLETLEDGQFMASSEAMGLLQSGTRGLDAAIWVMPLQDLILVIRELVAQREAIKQVIYELTGIADIMRGVSQASETLGAQQLKAQWGSLRVQVMQKEVQRFCRDLFRIKAEIIAEKFTPEILSMVAGEPLQPPVIELLQSDIQRRFMVDIETDSTIQADKTRDQQAITNFLTASAQYLQVAAPAVQSGMLPPDLALAVYQSFVSRFKLGKQVEDILARLGEQAQPMIQQQQQEKQKQKALQDRATQIGEATAVAEMQKKQAEAEGQRIENVRAMVEPTVADPGFIQ